MMLTVPIPPSANRYWRHVAAHTRFGRVYVKTYVSPEALRYREGVRVRALVAGIRPVTGPVAVTLRWYRPAKRGDTDNQAKVALDALQGVVYANDAQVCELHVYRFEDKLNPRLEIEVRDA